MTSRFFVGRDSDSSDTDSSGYSSNSGSESGSSSDEQTTRQPFQSSFAQLADSSSSEDEGAKRVVLTRMEKQAQAFAAIIRHIRDEMENDEWKEVKKWWDKLESEVKKALKPNGGGLKSPYWLLIGDMVTIMAEKMGDKGRNKQENAIFTRLNKEVTNLSKNHGPEITAAAESREETVEKPINESVSAPKKVIKPKLTGRAAYLKGAPDSDDESSEEEVVKRPVGRARFLKQRASSTSSSDSSGDDSDSGSEPKTTKGRAGRKERQLRRALAEETAVPVQAPLVPVVEVDPTKVTESAVDLRLEEVSAARGKKATTVEQLEKELDFLGLAAKSNVQRLKILMLQVSLQFDTQGSFLACMPAAAWRKAIQHLEDMVALMENNEELATFDKMGAEAKEGQSAGHLVAFIERLDDELTKGLQNTESRTAEYIGRLSDESTLIAVSTRVQSFYKSLGQWPFVARIAHSCIERLYYRHDGEFHDNIDRSTQLHKLAVLVYQYGDERRKTRVMLCHVYHHALHGRYHKARDMLLMSHLQDNIGHADVHTQILFNRVLIQLGLAAFSIGLFSDAHQCVADICQSGRQRELLAQGMMIKYGDHNIEQEKAEKRRQIPAHMHIPVDLIEVVHLTSAVLLEVPMIAQHGNSRRHVVSKSLRKHLDYMARQAMCGPPENAREGAMVAARALLRGDWKESENLLLSQKGWSYMRNSDGVRSLVSKRIREVGLEAYLFTNAHVYASMSVSNLCSMFDLKVSDVHAKISNLIYNGSLHIAWDMSTDSLIIESGEPTKLQSLALQYAEKVAALAESNGHPNGIAQKGKKKKGWVQR